MRSQRARMAAAMESIAEICDAPPSAAELLADVADQVRRVVQYDTGSWMTTDPLSLLPTTLVASGLTSELRRAATEFELGDDDGFNGFFDLMRSARPAAALSALTHGDLNASRRFREVHRPHGLGDELRTVARAAQTTWGMSCLNRSVGDAPFTDDDVRFVGGVARHLGTGLRTALLEHHDNHAVTGAPGVLVVDAALRVAASTAAAQRWFELLVPGGAADLPTPVEMVVLRALADDTAGHPRRAARVRVPVRGGWLVVHGEALVTAGRAPIEVAVVIEPAARAEMVPLLLALHGLTEREREVTDLLLHGHSTEDIARRLHLSRYTVRDHVKAIFAKVGVSSRPELTAALNSGENAA